VARQSLCCCRTRRRKKQAVSRPAGEPLDVAVHRAPSCCWFSVTQGPSAAWERGAPSRSQDEGLPALLEHANEKDASLRVAEFTPTTLTDHPLPEKSVRLKIGGPAEMEVNSAICSL